MPNSIQIPSFSKKPGIFRPIISNIDDCKMRLVNTPLWVILFSLSFISLTICISFGQLGSAQTSNKTNILAQSQNLPRFAQPIDCTLGKDCFILLYPDRDPGPEAIDFGCGRQTYNDHKGTDFAIPDERVMAAGVPVIAAATGTVVRVRDRIRDRRIRGETDKAEIQGIECGNGVVIDHNNGWETQYCHLRNGSVAVTPGTRVETGTVLGMVGVSGLASFPHVHFTIRYRGEVVDPFVGPNAGAGCNVSGQSIWTQPLDYVPTGLVRAGFADRLPDRNDIWSGRFWESTLSAQSNALVFWVQAYGVLEGDVESMRVIDSQGKTVAEQTQPIQQSRRIWLKYIGKRNSTQRPLIPGVWRGEYRLMRGNRVLVNVTREVELH